LGSVIGIIANAVKVDHAQNIRTKFKLEQAFMNNFVTAEKKLTEGVVTGTHKEAKDWFTKVLSQLKIDQLEARKCVYTSPEFWP